MVCRGDGQRDRAEPVLRRICNKPIVLYRKQNGQVAALADACWHRLLPLSLGTLNGDNVICAYHGLEFDDTGRCVYMPSQETINPSACVTQYPVVERHRFVWICPAIRRWPIRRWCPICIGTTIRTGSRTGG
jgi:phenylpropionate dioxygenase-like ring-hydroxylating dioxygenase large terminal subunit